MGFFAPKARLLPLDVSFTPSGSDRLFFIKISALKTVKSTLEKFFGKNIKKMSKKFQIGFEKMNNV